MINLIRFLRLCSSTPVSNIIKKNIETNNTSLLAIWKTLPQFITCSTMSTNTTTVTGDADGSKRLIAVCQMNCKDNKDDNFKSGEKLIREAAGLKCSMVFLPECFDIICDSRKAIMANLEPIEGDLIGKYRQLAAECKVWLSLGGLHEKPVNNDDGKSCISHIIINDQGKIASVYRKAHLFNLEIPGVVRLIESEFSNPGDQVNPPVPTPIGNVGQGICYDLRFPEFAISMAKAGADILTYPSSFTVPTGADHWEVLLRARAIENQCYVIAAAQVGVHNAKRSSWGHAMVVDPWGAVIAQCGDGVGLAVAQINPQHHRSCRSRLPVWTDRRPDIYGDVLAATEEVDIDSCPFYEFGKARIPSSQVFLRTRFSFAFVNHRPLKPGHSLVAPLRSTACRLGDLTQPELSDFFSSVQRVERILEQEYNAQSSLIAVQDGPDAGRSIDQLHGHIFPAEKGAFDPGNIYLKLVKLEKDDSKIRSEEDMKEESYRLRKYFTKKT
ncbi:deaminated glutathione amidase-like isoform X2 [Brevipalpus obovatus]|uniref:deaminated glutathione amidase-like isoform X2 n=1 Tax=Brevipalpus obovatus TaxID=246614 RepID=UPI003D9F3376